MEGAGGFARLELYGAYGEETAERKNACARVIAAAGDRRKRVAGYGASNTVTTLMWQFDLTEKLEFLADDNPRKQGLYSPGAHIPVVASEELYARRPDHVIILAWNYAEPIVTRHKRFLAEGGEFVIPLPDLKIVKAQD